MSWAGLIAYPFGRQVVVWWRWARVQKRFPGLKRAYPVYWRYDDLSAVSIGKETYIGPYSFVEVRRRSRESKVAGSLQIGDGAEIGWHANIRATGGVISIGADSILAQFVSLIASNHSISGQSAYKHMAWDETKTGVTIGSNVWIGAGATVLPGCVIGSNSVIGAGSVVTRSVPEGEIWGGAPARRLRAVKP